MPGKGRPPNAPSRRLTPRRPAGQFGRLGDACVARSDFFVLVVLQRGTKKSLIYARVFLGVGKDRRSPPLQRRLVSLFLTATHLPVVGFMATAGFNPGLHRSTGTSRSVGRIEQKT